MLAMVGTTNCVAGLYDLGMMEHPALLVATNASLTGSYSRPLKATALGEAAYIK